MSIAVFVRYRASHAVQTGVYLDHGCRTLSTAQLVQSVASSLVADGDGIASRLTYVFVAGDLQ